MVLPNEGSRFCLIENTTNLSISPSQDVLSEGHDYVNISCNNAEIGFGFFNINNLAISSVVFHMCGGHPSSEAVKYVNETDQFLYYNSSAPMVLFFSHCYNIKLHNTSTSVNVNQIHDYSALHRFVVGVNLCGDSEIKTVMPNDTSEEGNTGLTMFVYFTDTTLLSPPLHCTLNVTLDSLYLNHTYAELSFSDRVRVDWFSDFALFLTQSFLVNVNLYLRTSLAKVVFVNSDTASQVSFQGYNLPYNFCANSANTEGLQISLGVLFYETPGFTSNLTDILHPMRIYNTAFTAYQVHDDILTIKKLTGKLSHRVSLHNVSWCHNHNAFPAQLVVINLAKPCLETAGDLYISLNNTLLHRNFFYHGQRHLPDFQLSNVLLTRQTDQYDWD